MTSGFGKRFRIGPLQFARRLPGLQLDRGETAPVEPHGKGMVGEVRGPVPQTDPSPAVFNADAPLMRRRSLRRRGDGSQDLLVIRLETARTAKADSRDHGIRGSRINTVGDHLVARTLTIDGRHMMNFGKAIGKVEATRARKASEEDTETTK